jgi:hypothetical protein
MKKIIKYTIEIIAVCFIWIAVDYNRTVSCRQELFSSGWMMQLLFIVIAITILRYTNRK